MQILNLPISASVSADHASSICICHKSSHMGHIPNPWVCISGQGLVPMLCQIHIRHTLSFSVYPIQLISETSWYLSHAKWICLIFIRLIYSAFSSVMILMSHPCEKSIQALLSISCWLRFFQSRQANMFGSSRTIFFWPFQNSDKSDALWLFCPSFSFTMQKSHPLGHPLVRNP